jgi:hypothetical protein
MTYLIFLTAIIYLIHKGLVDVKVWTRRQDQIEIRVKYWYLISDWTYLIGTAAVMFLLKDVSYFSGVMQLSYWAFTRAFLIGALIGDECWDLIFGYVVNQDALYPFGNWFNGWGFNNKSERITFDCIRISIAVLIFFL